MEINLKKCIKCNEEKPETEEYFYFRKDSQKYRNKCKVCDKIAQKENRVLKEEQYSIKMKTYYKNNKEK